MAAKDGRFFYDRQDEWRPAVCTTGRRQSPINIVTADVQENSDLIALELSNSSSPYEGVFFNDDGFTAQFEITGEADRPTFTNHVGKYILQNVHFHWGATNQVGSEHLVDGNSGQLEVHFVHFREGSSGPMEEDHFGVIAVLADVDENAQVDGVWGQLNPSMIQPLNQNITIQEFRFDQLLPENSRDYYFYEGSLTAPACTETVNWFVLKERITVPAAYLEQLRLMEEEVGENERPLSTNFRDVQPINDRVVSTPSSHATFKQPVLSLLVFCVMAAVKLF